MRDNVWIKKKEANTTPLCRGTALRSSYWGRIGESEFEEREIRFAIRDIPSLPFKDVLLMEEVLQSESDKESGRKDFRTGCAEGVY